MIPSILCNHLLVCKAFYDVQGSAPPTQSQTETRVPEKKKQNIFYEGNLLPCDTSAYTLKEKQPFENTQRMLE